MTTQTRDISRPVPFLQAARASFDLAIEGMVWSRRSLAMAALIALPVLFGVLFRVALVAKAPPELTGFDLYSRLVAFYFVRNVLPLAALFYASALVSEEVEGRTIMYLLTRPVSRPALLAGKFAAYVVSSLTIVLPCLLLTFGLLVTARGLAGVGARVPDLFRDMGVSALTLIAYGALFALLGVLLRRPLIPGLLFLFGWELVANLPGYMPRLTITGYLRSLLPYRPADEGFSELFGQVLPAGLCLGVLFAVTVVCLSLAFGIFSRREYVLEQ